MCLACPSSPLWVLPGSCPSRVVTRFPIALAVGIKTRRIAWRGLFLTIILTIAMPAQRTSSSVQRISPVPYSGHSVPLSDAMSSSASGPEDGRLASRVSVRRGGLGSTDAFSCFAPLPPSVLYRELHARLLESKAVCPGLRLGRLHPNVCILPIASSGSRGSGRSVASSRECSGARSERCH